MTLDTQPLSPTERRQRELDEWTRGSSASRSEAAVLFDRVTKTYPILRRTTPRLGAWVVNKLFEHLRQVPFNALNDVSFRIGKGEMVGFVGANGAGKSTVLKLIAGITQPTSGTIQVHGRVTSLLELGIGFHLELSGMENIFYNGALMGLTRQQVLERLPAIVEFSGLQAFLYEPVKHYSSGMYARLACSVAMHLDPEILLVDEILVVGDAEFQQRGMVRILELHDRGVTIVLVTHEVATARDLCDRLLWLDHGQLVAEGHPRDVCAAYTRTMNYHAVPPEHFLSPAREPAPRPGHAPKLVSCRAETPAGEALQELRTSDPLRLVFEVDDSGCTAPWRLAIVARWPDGQVLFEDVSPVQDPRSLKDGRLIYDVRYWPLVRADVEISAALLSADGAHLLDRRLGCLRFRTLTDIAFTDCVMMPGGRWELKSSLPGNA